jgi:hypothetical protein
LQMIRGSCRRYCSPYWEFMTETSVWTSAITTAIVKGKR